MRIPTLPIVAFACVLGAPSLAQTPCHQAFGGNQHHAGMRVSQNNRQLAIETSYARPLIIRRVEIFTGLELQNGQVWLYDHDAATNLPGKPIGGGTFVVSRTVGWQGANVRPIAVPANTKFWVVYQLRKGSQDSSRGVGNNPNRHVLRYGSNAAWRLGDQKPFLEWKFRLFCNSFPASFQRYGWGCPPGPRKPLPRIAIDRVPRIGLTSTLQLHLAPAGRVVLLGLGESDKKWGPITLPLDLSGLGAPRCKLLTSLRVLLPSTTNSRGQALQPLAIPFQTGLLGLTLFGQWIVLDKPANALGLVFSDAGKLTIGT